MQENKKETPMPGISFSKKRGEIMVFRSTIQALSEPLYIRFLMNMEKGCLAVQACERKTVASLVKWYLMVCPGEPARRVMSWLMKPKTTMQIQHETVSVTREGSGVSFLLLPKTEVDVNRKDLATFVDFASGLMRDDLMEKNEAAPARDEGADLMSALVEGLDGVDGNQLTNGCSIGLFDFLYDCYRIVVADA